MPTGDGTHRTMSRMFLPKPAQNLDHEFVDSGNVHRALCRPGVGPARKPPSKRKELESGYRRGLLSPDAKDFITIRRIRRPHCTNDGQTRYGCIMLWYGRFCFPLTSTHGTGRPDKSNRASKAFLNLSRGTAFDRSNSGQTAPLRTRTLSAARRGFGRLSG